MTSSKEMPLPSHFASPSSSALSSEEVSFSLNASMAPATDTIRVFVQIEPTLKCVEMHMLRSSPVTSCRPPLLNRLPPSLSACKAQNWGFLLCPPSFFQPNCGIKSKFPATPDNENRERQTVANEAAVQSGKVLAFTSSEKIPFNVFELVKSGHFPIDGEFPRFLPEHLSFCELGLYFPEIRVAFCERFRVQYRPLPQPQNIKRPQKICATISPRSSHSYVASVSSSQSIKECDDSSSFISGFSFGRNSVVNSSARLRFRDNTDLPFNGGASTIRSHSKPSQSLFSLQLPRRNSRNVESPEKGTIQNGAAWAACFSNFPAHTGNANHGMLNADSDPRKSTPPPHFSSASVTPFSSAKVKSLSKISSPSDEDKAKIRKMQLRFFDFVMRQKYEKVARILDEGFDPNFHNPGGEQTPLITAVLAEDVRMMSLLVERGGAFVDYRSTNNLTPLHWAAQHNKQNSLRHLIIACAAHVDALDSDLTTPLHLASAAGHADCVHMLLRAHAKTCVFDSSGKTPLHLACLGAHTTCAKLLLTFGSPATSRNTNGDTPLHVAAATTQLDPVCSRLLLLGGADRNLLNLRGQSPYQLAVLAANDAVAALLSDFFPSENDIEVYCRENKTLTSVQEPYEIGCLNGEAFPTMMPVPLPTFLGSYVSPIATPISKGWKPKNQDSPGAQTLNRRSSMVSSFFSKLTNWRGQGAPPQGMSQIACSPLLSPERSQAPSLAPTRTSTRPPSPSPNIQNTVATAAAVANAAAAVAVSRRNTSKSESLKSIIISNNGEKTPKRRLQKTTAVPEVSVSSPAVNVTAEIFTKSSPSPLPRCISAKFKRQAPAPPSLHATPARRAEKSSPSLAPISIELQDSSQTTIRESGCGIQADKKTADQINCFEKQHASKISNPGTLHVKNSAPKTSAECFVCGVLKNAATNDVDVAILLRAALSLSEEQKTLVASVLKQNERLRSRVKELEANVVEA